MVRILLFLLKSLVALLATLGLVLVVVAIGLWFFWQEVRDWRLADDESLPERIVLTLDTAEGLREGPSQGPLGLPGLDGTPSLNQVLEALELGAEDPRVEGVVLRLGYGALSPAQAQELRGAILRFRESGRFAMGFAESFGEAGDGNEHYHLATGLEEIWLQPSGDLDLLGYRLEQPFLRDLLDDWDLRVQVDQREDWKGLVDLATRRELAEPVRENLQAVVDSHYEQLAAAVSEGRGLSPVEAADRIDEGPYTAEAALEAGLVDRLDYRDRFEAAALDAAGDAAGDAADLVGLQDYLDGASEPAADAATIALLYLEGPLRLGGETEGLAPGVTGAEALVGQLREAAEDAEIDAVVLRIDSPGGSPVASDMLWRAVQQVREAGKPVAISLGSVAASGGYYVAVAGQPLLAQGGSLIGSIGVAGGKPVLADFWPHLGLSWDGVQAGRNAGIWSINRDFTPEQWEHFQASLDRTYADFTAKVAEGRGLEGAALAAVVGGRVFTGEQALALGLVDELGSLREAATAAAREAGLEPDRPLVLLDYAERGRSFGALLTDLLRGELSGRTAGEVQALRLLVELQALLRPLQQALAPFAADPRERVLQAPALGSRE